MKSNWLAVLTVLLCLLIFSTVNAEETYKVSYVGNNCLAAVPTDEKAYKSGDAVQVLFDPVAYTDYKIFYGWDGDGDGIADFGYNYNTFVMGDSDVTLTAICIPAWSSNYNYPPAKPCRPGVNCGNWVRPWQGNDWFYNADPWGTCHGGNCGRGWRR